MAPDGNPTPSWQQHRICIQLFVPEQPNQCILGNYLSADTKFAATFCIFTPCLLPCTCCTPCTLPVVYCLAGLSVGSKSMPMCLTEMDMCALSASTSKGGCFFAVHTSVPGMCPTQQSAACMQVYYCYKQGPITACLPSVGMARLTISKPV